MLNTRYIKYSGQGPPIDNDSNALGNAWFVQGIKFVPNADEEMKSITGLDPKASAIVQEEFRDVVKEPSTIDLSASITLKEYATKTLTYTSKSSTELPAIFSEIYYPNGWICRVDGNEVPTFRANYILRGAMIPAGEHTIEWSFEPAAYKKGVTINWIGSIIFLLFTFGIIGWTLWKEISTDRKMKEAAL